MCNIDTKDVIAKKGNIVFDDNKKVKDYLVILWIFG